MTADAIPAERPVWVKVAGMKANARMGDEPETTVAGGETAGSDSGPTTVRAVLRAVQVLRAFTVVEPWATLTEVVARTGLDKATTRRLLVTLIEAGLVVQDRETHRYALSLAMIELSSAVPDNLGLRKAAAPILTDLAREIDGTTFLSIYREHSALCLEKFHHDRSIQVRWWAVGGALPANVGGAPKLLLAFQSSAEIERAIGQGLSRLTPHSITDADAFREELGRIRTQGHVIAVDDVVEGLAAMAAPVRDRDGRVIAAVSLAGLTPHIAGSRAAANLAALLDAARRISQSVG